MANHKSICLQKTTVQEHITSWIYLCITWVLKAYIQGYNRSHCIQTNHHSVFTWALFFMVWLPTPHIFLSADEEYSQIQQFFYYISWEKNLPCTVALHEIKWKQRLQIKRVTSHGQKYFCYSWELGVCRFKAKWGVNTKAFKDLGS